MREVATTYAAFKCNNFSIFDCMFESRGAGVYVMKICMNRGGLC